MSKIGRYLYECVLAAPLSVAVLLFCYSDIGLKEPGVYACVYAVFYCAACAFLLYLKGKDRLLAAGAVVVLLGLPAAYGLLIGNNAYFEAHIYIWLIPAISALCFLLGLLCKELRVVRYLTAIGILAFLVGCLFLDYYASKLCVMLLLSVLILVIADETQVLWRKSGRTDHALHLTFVAPFVYAWLLFCLLFPIGQKPYTWNIVRALWDKVNDLGISISQWANGKNDDFDSYLPGFSESSRVHGGGIRDDAKVLFIVEPVMGTPISVRLAGEVCDTFDDMEWMNTAEENAYELEFDALETNLAMEQVPRYADYMQAVELRLTYREFTSKHMFLPDKAFITSSEWPDLEVSAKGRTLLFEKKKGVNDEYVVSGYRLNLLHTAFSDFMNSAKEITADDWAWIARRYDVPAYVTSYENFLNYRAEIRARYGKTFVLSDAAAAFVQEAVGDAVTPYDRMMRIGKALNSFAYTTTPGRFPGSVKDASGFLDYFLSTQQGYCTHFATAMVLFAWSEGLPARYVHGFSVALSGRDPVEVTANQAHAWCEIYFENVGWIPFDVTPGFNYDSYWAMSSEKNDKVWDTPVKVTPAPTIVPQIPEEKTPVPVLRILLLVLLAVAFLAVFTVIVLLSDRAITLRRFARLSDREKVPALYRRNQRILSYLDLGIQKEETLTEYQKRISESLPYLATAWVPFYEEFLYGTPSDISFLLKTLKAANETLLKEFRTRNPKRYRLCALGNRLIR